MTAGKRTTDAAARAADQAIVRAAADKVAGMTAGEFPPPERLDTAAAAVWVEVIRAHHDPARIVGPDLEAYCGQVATQRDARERIAREGLIVEDERGRPEPHPAIALELKAQAEIRAWGDKFRGRTARPQREGRTR